MNLRKFMIYVAAAFLSVAAHATEKKDTAHVKVKFAYDLNFDMQFDNREFYKSAFTNSMTIFSARLTPAFGVSFQQNDGTRHKLMAGIDVMKEFGNSQASNWKIFREVSLYYTLQKKMGKTDFELDAGVFPRRFSEGSYSPAFISDSLRFYDNNLEGLLLKFRRPKAYYEIGCDWMGMYDPNARERFMIFSSGEGSVLPFLSLGYAAYLYHFSISGKASGVVDNVLGNAYMRFDLGDITGLQTLSFRLGWIQAMQNDRLFVGKYVFPGGGEFVTEIRNWNVGIRNDLYVGTDLMPYYNRIDDAGDKYGNLLYRGSPFYRVYDDGTQGIGLTDRLEVYYAPKIGNPYLNLKVAALFYFNVRGYCGCRQMVSLNFNLQELLARRRR